jgi:SAM-dependent methyltransferase
MEPQSPPDANSKRAMQTRSKAYGESGKLSLVDHLGVWMSSRAVRRHVDFDGRRVGDFGCGYQANFSRSILPTIQHLVLVDVCLAEDLEHHPKVRAMKGRIESVLPTLASESLDVIMCLSVLEHLAEPQEALDGFRRILAPGGIMVVNVPSWRGKPWLELSAFRLGLSPAVEMDDHKCYYDPRDLWPMLVRAGFRPSAIACRRHKFGLNTFAVSRVPGRGAEIVDSRDMGTI